MQACVRVYGVHRWDVCVRAGARAECSRHSSTQVKHVCNHNRRWRRLKAEIRGHDGVFAMYGVCERNHLLASGTA